MGPAKGIFSSVLTLTCFQVSGYSYSGASEDFAGRGGAHIIDMVGAGVHLRHNVDGPHDVGCFFCCKISPGSQGIWWIFMRRFIMRE